MHQVQKSILELLKVSNSPLTISQIAAIIKVERHTAGKYLDALEAMGMCAFETKGKSKLWSLTASPLYNLISKDNPVSTELKQLLEKVEENVTFQDDNHHILWSNKPQQAGKKCYEVFANKNDACNDCDVSHSVNGSEIIKGVCEEHNITRTPIVDTNNTMVASINIRRKGENDE